MMIKLYPVDGSEPTVGVEPMVFKKSNSENISEIEKWKMTVVEEVADES